MNKFTIVNCFLLLCSFGAVKGFGELCASGSGSCVSCEKAECSNSSATKQDCPDSNCCCSESNLPGLSMPCTLMAGGTGTCVDAGSTSSCVSVTTSTCSNGVCCELVQLDAGVACSASGKCAQATHCSSSTSQSSCATGLVCCESLPGFTL